MKYLVFRLYGPMASWGNTAVGGTRPSYGYPTKSAVLGLTAAALGIERSDEEANMKLWESFNMGIKMISPGKLLEDFHTIQYSGLTKRKFATRRDELLYDPLKQKTFLSRRQYRSDGLWIIALWLKEGAGYTLEEVQKALDFPVFHLYLGRKSCPPGLPLAPGIVKKGNLKEALDSFEWDSLFNSEWEKRREIRIFDNKVIYYFWEEHDNPGISFLEKGVRYDKLLNRERWQFSAREEFMAREELTREERT